MMKKYFAIILLVIIFVKAANAQCSAYFSYSTSGQFTFGFINLSSVPQGVIYSWDFGDGQTSSQASPTHTYASFGTYTVCLTISSDSVNCSSTYCDTIKIICPAVAGIQYILGSDYGYDFEYTSNSNDLVTWLWSFGDGGTSTARNPNHTFARTGIYDICLKVTDVATQCSADSCIELSVCVAQALFTYSNSSRFDYTFKDRSNGEDASTTWTWYFGDGDSSKLQNPTHVYTTPGSYNVCLTIDVVDSGCTNSVCNVIQVACADSAAFSYQNIGGTTFQFTDLSTGEDSTVTYTWGFDDGSGSALKDPTHLFTSTANLDITFRIDNVDQGCTSTAVQSISIVCNDSASFTYTNTGVDYNFTDASKGEDTSVVFSWTFSNEGTSTSKDPGHTFTSIGSQQVCLRMTNNDDGCTSKFCENVNVACPLSASFSFSTANNATNFTDASTGEDGTATWLWTFGDGDSSTSKNPSHIYGSSGSYHVCLIVKDVDLNCSSAQYCQTIEVNVTGCPDKAAFNYTAVADSFSFQNVSQSVSNSATYSWNFGDGDTSNAESPTHVFATPGTYTVCLFITDPGNTCSSDTCRTVVVKAACTDSAGFTYTHTGVDYQFTDASTGEDGSVVFSWNFGDGDTSNLKSPSHTYTTIGAHNVCLTINNVDVNCSSTFCENITVACPLSVSYTYSSSGATLSFQDVSTGEDGSATYKWTFGDGDSSTAKSPSHTYDSTNTYQVCLTVTDADLDCSAPADCQSIMVNISGCPDTASFTYTNVADSFNFQNVSKNVSNSATYHWTFGDQDTSDLQNPAHTYTATGTYQVCLMISDPHNSCSADTCQNIDVINGIAEIGAINSVKLYPNPAAGFVNIDLNGFKARIIVIYNQLGETVKQITPDSKGLNVINILTLPAGIYLVSTRSDDEVFSSTLVVTNK
jgi:PKD repeat protein